MLSVLPGGIAMLKLRFMDENHRLKQMFVDFSLECRTLNKGREITERWLNISASGPMNP